MSEMSPERAFEILGLSHDADEEELKKNFREKSQVHHPDTPKGDEQIQKLLNEAREIAGAVILGRSSLVALKSGRSILRFEKALAIEKAARQADDAEKSFKKRHTRSLHFLKYGALVLGVVSAALGWFGDNLLSEAAKKLDPSGTGNFELNFKLFALFFAAIAGGLQLLVQHTEARIEQFKEELGDPRICASKLAQALDYNDTSIIDEDKFLMGDREPPSDHSTASERSESRPTPLAAFRLLLGTPLDRSERRKILLLKSVEHGLLVPAAHDIVRPDTVFSYQLAFAPSAFRPKDGSVTSLSPMPAESSSGFRPREGNVSSSSTVPATDAKEMIVTGFGLFAVFGGLAVFLWVGKHSWWAVAPALLGAPGSLLMLGGIAEWLTAKRRGESSKNQNSVKQPEAPRSDNT